VFLGMLQLSRGRIMWIDSRHLPVFSGAEIALGVVLLLLSITPFSWIEKGLVGLIATPNSRSLINQLLDAHYRHAARIGVYWSLPLASTRQVCSTASPRIPYTHSCRFMATQI
jgi:hypothetical protein